MDRLTSATGLGFNWDSNGNMLYRHDGVNAWNYTYDPVNRLKTAMKDGVVSARYTYDASGRRVRSWDTRDGVVDYVYSGLNIIAEISGGVHEKHVYAGGMHVASNTSGTIEYYHVDHLGSTRLKTAANGSAIYESNYEPFGPSSGEVGDEDYRYTGKHEDPSGLYYFGARYYDPLTGRFTTRDTVFGSLGDPQSQNRYVYCRNNPQKYTDPDGNNPILTGALMGACVDVSFYMIECAYYGNQFSWRKAAHVALKGAITGAIGGAISTITFTSKVLTNATRTTASLTSNIVVDYVDAQVSSSGSDETFEEVFTDNSGGSASGTFVDTLSDARTPNQIVEALDEGRVVDASNMRTWTTPSLTPYKDAYLGAVASNTLSLVVPIVYKRIDMWWQQSDFSQVDYTSSSSTGGSSNQY